MEMRGVGTDLHKKQVFKSFELEKKTKNFLHILKAQKPPDKKKTIYVTKVLKHKQIQCFWLLFAFCSLRDHQGQYSGYKLLTRPRMTVPSVSKQTRDLSHAHQHKWPSLQASPSTIHALTFCGKQE